MSLSLSEAEEKVLNDLYARKGSLAPADVVLVAQSPSNPLHDRFEWDDSKAAHAHRLGQARTVIRSVKVTIVVEPEKPPRQVPVYHHDPVEDGYRSTEDVATHPDLRARVEDEMRRDLERLKRKYELHAALFAKVAEDVLAGV